jgi:hypothetical protein
MEAYGEVDGPRFVDLGHSWTGVVSFTPWPLYPRLGEPLDNVGKGKFLTASKRELRRPSPVLHVVFIQTELSRSTYPYSR